MKKKENTKIAQFFVEMICDLHKLGLMDSVICIKMKLEDIPEQYRDKVRQEAMRQKISIEQLLKKNLLEIAKHYKEGAA